MAMWRTPRVRCAVIRRRVLGPPYAAENKVAPFDINLCALEPSLQQAFVMTLLRELLLHHARYRLALGGSAVPDTFSIRSKVIGISSAFCRRRKSPSAEYLPIASLIGTLTLCTYLA